MAIVKNSPFGVIRGSIGETTFQLVDGNNIMRKKPYNTFKQTPHVPDWPYPIDEAIIAYVDNFYSINESFIQSTWASPNIDDGIEADFKRFNYLRCQLFGMSEYNISYGYGDFKLIQPIRVTPFPYLPTYLTLMTKEWSGETPTEGKIRYDYFIERLPGQKFNFTLGNYPGTNAIPATSGITIGDIIFIRQIGYSDDKKNGHLPEYRIIEITEYEEG